MTTITTNVNLAIERLELGDVVAIPTETVYGLAADATNEVAIKKIFSIKKRPLNHPLIMHVCHDWDLSQWVFDIPEYAEQMILAFWPGPLTLVLNCKKNSISPLVNGGQDSVAVRSPKHDLTQHILRQLNRPLVAPSANPFGQISPTTASHVALSFPHEDFLILDGGRCDVGIESSIIQATHHKGYSILRHGMIDLKSIEATIPAHTLLNQASPRVSGQLDSHYKPQKRLYYIENWQDFDKYSRLLKEKIYTISISEHTPEDDNFHYQLPCDQRIVAYQLYDQLRYADQSVAEIIVIELPPNYNEWQAIREKIMKAGEPINAND